MTEDISLWLMILMTVPPLCAGIVMLRLHRGFYNGADMRLRRPEESLTRSLEDGLGATRVASRTWTLDRGKGPWTLKFMHGGDGPARLFVSKRLPISDSPDAHPKHPRMLFSLETPLHRWGKRLGVSRELQVGDAEFQRTVFVESNPDCPVAKAVLESAATRQEVARLVQRGVRSVGTMQRQGEVYGSLMQHADWGEPEQLAEWLDRLEAFVATLPPARGLPALSGFWTPRLCAALLIYPGVLGAIFFAALGSVDVLMIDPYHRSQTREEAKAMKAL